ncbi:hypothetical protein LGQ02_20695 [Bacillus shivajii]|uniref:tubby C-terminal domain-like protein n=1 Tax=Bacillus shivajii TaxID=1983719 RepID=UPI001CFB9DDD|nr:hypothetical protein [Bacillus shivajii]UCZ53163.1 hypothetical protein LGQ02_20695 [Bacillus shivajii]
MDTNIKRFDLTIPILKTSSKEIDVFDEEGLLFGVIQRKYQNYFLWMLGKIAEVDVGTVFKVNNQVVVSSKNQPLKSIFSRYKWKVADSRYELEYEVKETNKIRTNWKFEFIISDVKYIMTGNMGVTNVHLYKSDNQMGVMNLSASVPRKASLELSEDENLNYEALICLFYTVYLVM